MHWFLIVIEKIENNYSAYVPDLPGCIATGNTREEAEENIHQAVLLHLEGLREDHIPIPESQSFGEYIAVE